MNIDPLRCSCIVSSILSLRPKIIRGSDGERATMLLCAELEVVHKRAKHESAKAACQNAKNFEGVTS